MKVHRAHIAGPDLGEENEAAHRLLAIEEILFVTVAFLRNKYLRTGTPREKTARLLREVCPGALLEPGLRTEARNVDEHLAIPRLRAMYSDAGQARLAAAFGVLPDNPRTLQGLQMNVRNILERWNPENLTEGSPFNHENETAYTVDQGRSMVYCLRKKGTDAFIAEPLQSFVALHEICHIFTESYEHPPRFWNHFKWVLLEVEEAGIFVSTDYERYPQDYCGLWLNHNPRFDPRSPDIRMLPVHAWGKE